MGEGCCARDHGPVAPENIQNIWKACQEGCLDSVKAVVSQDPQIVNMPGEVDQVPPLHWAALNGHIHVCQYLLDSGAIINQLGGDQWSTALHWAACRGQVGTMALLVSRGADYRSLRDQQGYLPVHIAAQHGQTFSLIYLISLSKAEMIDAQDLNGRSPLIWAAYRGHDEATSVLIREGANIQHKDRSGSSALHWAAVKGNALIVRLLLQAGADPHDRDEDGKSAIDLAKEKAWPWLTQILQETGHKIAKNSPSHDLESGLISSKHRRWLPERLFRPLLDDSSLRFLLGRILPPLVAIGFFCTVAFAYNLIVGIGLGLLLVGAARALYFVLQPKPTNQHDKSVAVLNSLHHTVLVLVGIVNMFVFIPSGSSSTTLIMAIQVSVMAVIYLLILAEKTDSGRIGRPKNDEEHSEVQPLLSMVFNEPLACVSSCRE